jgi:hypothetical protein
MIPNDDPDFIEINQTRSDLRDGIENSREMVRQSRLLLELSECDAAAHEADGFPVAD